MSALFKEIPTSNERDYTTTMLSNQHLFDAIVDKCLDLNHEQLLTVLFDLNFIEQGIEASNSQVQKLTEKVKRLNKKFYYWYARSSELTSRLKQIELENRIFKYQLLKAKEVFDEVLKDLLEKRETA